MSVVGVDDVGAAVPEVQGGGLLPCVGETVNVYQFGSVASVMDQESECSARINRLELRVVADQQHFRVCPCCEAGDSVKGERACE